MDVQGLEKRLLAVRAGIAARQALADGVPERGAVVEFEVAVWDGRNASADLLTCSFEPGSVLAEGVHELVRTGRCGGHDLTVGTWVIVGHHDGPLPFPAKVLSWRPDLKRRPLADPAEEPTELPWMASLQPEMRLDAAPRVVLERRLRRLAGRGDAALAALVAQFAPVVERTVSRRRAVIERNAAYGVDDARACVNAELVDVLLRFASADRPNATVLRTLRFALPNRLDAALGTVDRAATGSAEKAEIRLFVRNHHELEAMPDAQRATGADLERHLKALAQRMGLTDAERALTAVRFAEDVQWSISMSRARRAAASRDERLADDFVPVKHRFSVPHICEALGHQVTLVSLDQPASTGEDGPTTELHQLVADVPEAGFDLVDNAAMVGELLAPAATLELEAAVWSLVRAGRSFAEVAQELGLSDPDAAGAAAKARTADLPAPAAAVAAGSDLTGLEREVFVMRSGLVGEVAGWTEVCDRTGLSGRYKSKTAAETRARNVLRRAERLVRGRAALYSAMPAERRAELLYERAEALREKPFALAA